MKLQTPPGPGRLTRRERDILLREAFPELRWKEGLLATKEVAVLMLAKREFEEERFALENLDRVFIAACPRLGSAQDSFRTLASYGCARIAVRYGSKTWWTLTEKALRYARQYLEAV